MNNLKQIYKESKLKLDSMTIIMLITMAVSAVFIVIAMVLALEIVPYPLRRKLLSGVSSYRNSLALDFLTVLPVMLSSFAMAIFYNIKNNKKSFDHIGATSATYCVSNTFSMLIMAIVISIFMAVIEIIIIFAAGTTPLFPILGDIKFDAMIRMWTNFGVYILIAYSTFQVVTYLINNIMNRNYIRAVLLIGIPTAIIIIYILSIELTYGVAIDLSIYQKLMSTKRLGIISLSGILISNIVDTALCIYGGRIR